MFKYLELKFPPLLLMLAVALIMFLSRHSTSFIFIIPFKHVIFLIGLLVGSALVLGGAWYFRQANTTVNPVKPQTTSTIVTHGVYQLSRNPMYLGFLVMLIGWAIYLEQAINIAWILFFYMYMNRLQIIPEEILLSQYFGNEYNDYKKRVRRWL